MAKKKRKGNPENNKRVIVVIGLLVNVFFWPGLGTIIGGETKKGVIQMVAILISTVLILVLIGIPLVIGIWVWALVTSIKQLQNL